MASLKKIAACIGLPANFRVIRDFYGYTTGVPQKISLAKQVSLLKGKYGKHIHLNLIRVGVESFTADDEAEIDAAVQKTRDVYARVNLGIGRVRRYAIPLAEANGHENIDSASEASDLTDEFTVQNDALDVFFVLTYAGIDVGLSPICGSCDKDSKGTTGAVVAIEKFPFQTAVTLAHEVGHYLGLCHVDDDKNIMYNFAFEDGITEDQGSTMRDHCFVKSGC
jgi:hypothetical protein